MSQEISRFPQCTHPTGRHSLALLPQEEMATMGPKVHCSVCGVKFYMFSKQQVEQMKELYPLIHFIPPINNN